MGLASRTSAPVSSPDSLSTSCLISISAAYDTQLQYRATSLRIESLGMSPRLATQIERRHEEYAVPAMSNALDLTTSAVANAMRLTIVLLGALTLSLVTIWLLGRIRLRWKRHRRNKISLVSGLEADYPPMSSNFLVLESDISIDMIIEDVKTPSSGTEFDDMSELGSMETIVSPVSATSLNFDIDKLPGILKGGILERRGRNDLQCDTFAYYSVDTIEPRTGPISARLESKRSVTRPVFGFNFQEITPPVGSPLWNRMIDAPRRVCPGPLTHPPKFA